MRQIKSCAHCSRTFAAYPSQHRIYCSRRCYWTAMSGTAKGFSGRYVIHTDDDFWNLVDKSGACWIWRGRRNKRGYGHPCIHGRPILAHRHAWILTRGEIPAGLCALHHCDNPPCVNPDHLYLGTYADNARDREERGRRIYAHGSALAHARLTEKAVLEIRARCSAGETQRALAREFNVNYRTIGVVVRRQTWRHI